MSRTATHRTPALVLVRNMIRIRRQLEPLLDTKGGLRLWRLRETRDERFGRLNEAWGLHCEVLLQRYGWLMNQLYARLSGSMAPGVSREQYMRSWWRIVRNELPGLKKAENFSSCLWTAVAGAAGRLESDPEFEPVAMLKPKFMLRQFVDEMKDRESTAALRVLAYTALSTDTELTSASAEELADIVYRACLALHDTVTRFGPLLPEMTAGAIDVGGPNDEVTVARRYTAWLFLS